MRVGTRGQVTIPKELRHRFGLGAGTEVQFRVARGNIILQKKPIDLAKWKGWCRRSFEDMDYGSVDEFLDHVRGR